MKIKTLLKRLNKVDPRMKVRIAGFRLGSGIDHSYKVKSAKVGYEVDGEVSKRKGKKVFLIREDV